MPYFDGREYGPTGKELEQVREELKTDVNATRTYFTGEDIDVEAFGDGSGVVVGDVSGRHLYPRPPTEELARELYMNDNLTEHEFEHMIGQALEREGVGWGHD